MASARETHAASGRAGVLALLKREGPVSADALADRLGVTAMAVRQHLAALSEEGFASSQEENRARARGRGRPLRLWRATEKADAQFADSHSALAIELISQMRKAFGEEGLEKLLKLRTVEQEKIYRAETDGRASLRPRLEALAKIRTREGYMAEVRRDPDTGDLLLVENHCPVCAAARICTGLCREELAVFQRVLGKDVRVERVSHILAGAARCAYRVTDR